MLKVELRSLERKDLVLEEKAPAEALGIQLSPDLKSGPLEIHCEVSKNGDVISAKGWVSGGMFLECDRCLKKFENFFKSFFEIHYRHRSDFQHQAGEVFEGPDEVETVFFEGDVLDFADEIRQTILLSIPMRVLCREDCRGLCPKCGCDRNVDSCGCAESPSDSRWDTLRNWKPF